MSTVAADPADEYPSELDDDLVLPGCRALHIRALRPCEEQPIRDLYARLSPRTRYLRFFSPVPSAPDALVRLLTSVDYRRQLALVAEHRGEIVGLASFGAVDDGRAEVGLVVSDDWQRQGVGTALAGRVLRAAERRGFRRFVVHVLPENAAIRRLLSNVGDVVSAKVGGGGIAEITFVRRVAAASFPGHTPSTD